MESRYKEFTTRYRNHLFYVVLFSVVLNVLLLAVPLYMLQIYRVILPSHSTDTLLYITGIVIFLLVLYALLLSARSQVLVDLSIRFAQDVNDQLTPTAIDQVIEGEEYPHQMGADIQRVGAVLTSPGFVALLDLPWSPLFFLVIFLLHPLLGAFSVVIGLVMIGLVVLDDRMLKKKTEALGVVRKNGQFLWSSILRNAEMLQGMGIGADIHKRFLGTKGVEDRLQYAMGMTGSKTTSIIKFTRLFAQVFILALGCYLFFRGQVNSGAIIAASILMGRALLPIELSITSWKGLLEGGAAFRRISEAVEKPSARTGTKRVAEPRGEVTVENLTFVFPKNKQIVLRELNFGITAGKMIAIVGPSGSGKTTLGRLMLGILKPTIGHILLDGANVYHADRAELGPFLGYLPQDIELFPGTVLENISRFGSADPDKVLAAAKLSGADQMILRLPAGFETEISQSGKGLSQGQMQRVALSRALYGTPKLVFLDEPDSNLDEEGEKALVQTLKELKARQVTTILVSHRMKALEVVDEILWLSQGRIKMKGERAKVLEQFRVEGHPQ